MLLTLLRLEAGRARRERFLWIACGIQVLIAFIAHQGARSLAGPAGLDGPNYFVFALNLAGTLTTPLLSAVFAAGLVAGDHGRGTIRVLLSWPVTRTEVLGAKMLVGLAVGLALHGIHALAALGISLSLPLEAAPDPVEPLRSVSKVWVELALAVVAQTLPLAATVAFALAVSTFCQQASTAIGMTVGILLILEPLKALMPPGWDQWIFSTHYDAPTAIAASRIDGISATWLGGEIRWLAGSCAAGVGGWWLAARWFFLRQAITP